MLLSKAIEEFEQYMEGREYSDSTIRGYLGQMNVFRRWIEGERNGPVYLDEIELSDLEDFISAQKKQGKEASSRSRTGYIFRSFFKFVERRELGENQAKALEPVQPRKKERTYLTEGEMHRVIGEIEKPLIRAATVFLFRTGCRIGEATSLELNDLDMENGIVHIRDGKGGKDRRLAMSSDLKEELEAYLDEVRPDVESDFVFATERSGSLSRVYYNSCLKGAVDRAGIDKDITAHCIRHTTAALLVKKGKDLATVQRILGHEDLKTTSIYVHSDMTQVRDALEAI